MDGTYFVGRKEILDWTNGVCETNFEQSQSHTELASSLRTVRFHCELLFELGDDNLEYFIKSIDNEKYEKNTQQEQKNHYD